MIYTFAILFPKFISNMINNVHTHSYFENNFRYEQKNSYKPVHTLATKFTAQPTRGSYPPSADNIFPTPRFEIF